MTLVCTGCRRRFDLIVDTPYTRTLAAFLSQCPSCGGAVERLSDLIAASATSPLCPTIYTLSNQYQNVDKPAPSVPYALTDDDRAFLRVNRIDPES